VRMMAAALAALAIVSASPSGQTPQSGESRAAALAADPAVRAALDQAASEAGRYIDDWIRIARIPAPSGREQARGAWMERRFRDLGLDDVHVDEAGNVVGLLRGRDPALANVAIAAHLDTVAPAGADHTVRRLPGGRLEGPGVRDDASGLAAVVAVLDLMKAHDLRPPADTWIVATVREETGLHGAARFVEDHGGELGAFIAVDGQLGQVSYAATGIVWLKIHFLGEGAHTLTAYQQANPVLAAARAIEDLSAIPMRRSPEAMESWLNIGAIGGGDVPNAQARDAWFTVDLRSNDPATLAGLERKVDAVCRETARRIGVVCEKETLHRMEGASLPGAEEATLARSAAEVLEHLAWDQIHLTPRGTADHNVAIRRGIPGIAIGITTGEGAHTPGETADTGPFVLGVRQLLLLALMHLTNAGPEG